jgi:hypothetical protein
MARKAGCKASNMPRVRRRREPVRMSITTKLATLGAVAVLLHLTPAVQQAP